MQRDAFEDEYLDVLQNIELPIVRVFRAHPELVDWNVEQALDAVIHAYESEARPRFRPAGRLPPLAQELSERITAMCDWRLGRATIPESTVTGPDGKKLPAEPQPKTVDEVVACLRRIRSSVRFWNKDGGRRGYLTF